MWCKKKEEYKKREISTKMFYNAVVSYSIIVMFTYACAILIKRDFYGFKKINKNTFSCNLRLNGIGISETIFI